MGPFERGENPILGIPMGTGSGVPDSVNLTVRAPTPTEATYALAYNSSTAQWETGGHTFAVAGSHELVFVCYESAATKDVKRIVVKVNDSDVTYPYPTP